MNLIKEKWPILLVILLEIVIGLAWITYYDVG